MLQGCTPCGGGVCVENPNPLFENPKYVYVGGAYKKMECPHMTKTIKLCTLHSTEHKIAKTAAKMLKCINTLRSMPVVLQSVI